MSDAPHVSLLVLGDDHRVVAPDAWEVVPCASASAADRSAAVRAARGAFVAFADAGDEIHPDAPALLAEALGRPDADVVYTDEDSVDGITHFDPFLKPDWSPERLLAQPYTGRLTLVRRALAGSAADACSDGDGFEHEWVLRATEGARSIVHVEAVCYHRTADRADGRSPRALPGPAAPAAVDEHLTRLGRPLRAEPTDDPGILRVVPALSYHPRVSVVIPTGGTGRRIRGRHSDLVVDCVRRIADESTYPDVEVLCVADRTTPPHVVQALRDLSTERCRVRIVWFDRPFNFSEKINVGALEATGDFLLLLNDDVHAVSPDWIETLVAYAQDPGVGAVGPRLVFEDGRLQHVGVIFSEGSPGHCFYCYPGTTAGYFGSPWVPADYLVVTAACLLVRREAFDRVGGLSPRFAVNYNDVDFCLKLVAAGYRNVYTPYPVLEHHESASRVDNSVSGEDHDLLRRQWGSRLDHDPYYSERFLAGANFLTLVRADGRAAHEVPLGYRNVRSALSRARAWRARSRT